MITFPVSDVAIERGALPAVPASEWLARLGWRAPEGWELAADRLVDGAAIHPLALAATIAFNTHRPLTITPDAIWPTLAQGLAQHVELHAERLRGRLVRHEGTLELDVRRDDFVVGAADNDWPAAVDALAARVREHVGGRAALFTSDFSTTTRLDRTASQVALLGAMRNYFNYSVSSLCGIPEISLAGTPDDWASIRARVRAFDDFDLAHWVARLDPILAQLEATARGQVDRAFWRRFYKWELMSGGERFQGWLGDLFPYLGTAAEPNEFDDFDPDDPFEGIKPSELPSGRTRVPFTWKVPGAELSRELIAGLFGVRQDPETGAVSVVSGWCVTAPPVRSGFQRTPGTVTSIHAVAGASLTSLEGLQHEATTLPTSLWLNPCSRLESLAGLEHLAGLEYLAVSDAPVLRDCAALARTPGVRRLTFNSCSVLEDLSFLATLPNLEALTLYYCPTISRAQLVHVARLDRLTDLYIGHCRMLGDLSGHWKGRDAVAQLQATLG
jgi:hypothetical protein